MIGSSQDNRKRLHSRWRLHRPNAARWLIAALATVVVIMSAGVAVDVSGAQPPRLEIHGGGLGQPMIVGSHEIPDLDSFSWTWAISCYQCSADDLLSLDSSRLSLSGPPSGVSYRLTWKFTPPMTSRDVVVSEWDYYPNLSGQRGFFLLRYHMDKPDWAGAWFMARQENERFLAEILLSSGCTVGGRLRCLPLGAEHSWVRIPFPVVR